MKKENCSFKGGGGRTRTPPPKKKKTMVGQLFLEKMFWGWIWESRDSFFSEKKGKVIPCSGTEDWKDTGTNSGKSGKAFCSGVLLSFGVLRHKNHGHFYKCKSATESLLFNFFFKQK